MIFFLAGKQEQCSEVIHCQFFNIHAKNRGVPLADEKTVAPTEKLVFLGIEF